MGYDVFVNGSCTRAKSLALRSRGLLGALGTSGQT